jgi:SAM-dependent methyltransferase
MSKVPDLIKHYSAYYGDARLARWRELGARDKSANIMGLWSCVNGGVKPSVVDVGCGDGAIIRELDRNGFGRNYMGLEISESAIDQAQQHEHISPTTFKLFDGHRLPVEDGSVDLVILSHVLEHVEEPRRLLYEAMRIGRYVFVEVPLELNLRTPHDFRWTDVGHINLYDPVVIRHLMQSVGLRILAEQTVCPSIDVFKFLRPGIKGTLHWAIKASLLKAAPFAAWRLFSYHETVLASTADVAQSILRPSL